MLGIPAWDASRETFPGFIPAPVPSLLESVKDISQFWPMLKDSKSIAKDSGGAAGEFWLAAVAQRIFCVLPNAANAERVFSEIGRTIVPS